MLPMNSFSFGAQIGGSDYSEAARRQEQQLRDAFNRWSGSYSPDVREFAFLLRIDGKIHRYTEMWQIRGAQKARPKQDWIEVEIGVPEDGGGRPMAMDTRSVWRKKSRLVSGR
jgi:hypothetical protein